MGCAGTSSEPLTAEPFALLPDTGADRLELVPGRVVREPPATPEQGAVAVRLAVRLHDYVEQTGLGIVLINAGFVLATDPDTVRAPALAFVAKDRIPAPDRGEPYWRLAPDLAVEILSPVDTASEIQARVLDYLHGGSRMVRVVDPQYRTVTTYGSSREIRILRPGEDLPGEDALPGFAVAVDGVFG